MSLEYLLAHEDKINPKMGGVVLGERAWFRDKDLHKELGHLTWFELYLYGITGRFFTEKEIALLNYIWVSTNYPDARIWPNRIAALAGSFRSTPCLAIAVGAAACEADIYGSRTVKIIMDFLIRAQQRYEKGASLQTVIDEELRMRPYIKGYGRPMAKQDERIQPFIKKASELGFAEGSHFQLAFKIEEILIAKKDLSMNIAALYAAVLADLNLNIHEAHLFICIFLVGGMSPCYLQALENPEGCFLPLRCDRVRYEGKPRRHYVPLSEEEKG